MRAWIWAALAIAAAPLAAHGEDFLVRDDRGVAVERIVPGIAPGRMERRDPSGRRLGTVEEGVGNTLILRDLSGRRTGTVEPGSGGERIVRDARGRRVETLEPRFTGEGYVRRDSSGRRLGTVVPQTP